MRTRALAAIVFFFGAALHFSLLSWGTPSWEKNLRIFKTKEEFSKWVEPVLQSREKYYGLYTKMLDPKLSEDESREIYQKLFIREKGVPLFEPIPVELILERVRSTLLGVMLSDEQYTIKAIGNMNPKKLDFNPDIYAAYGGFFYYTAAAFLFAGSLAGWLDLVPDVRFYLLHPEQTARMYVLVRAVGSCALLLTLLLFFAKYQKWIGVKTAVLAGAFLVVLPITFFLTHTIKAHLYGMLLFMTGFYFYWKSLEDPAFKNYFLGALCLGLSAGSIVTNLPIGVTLILIECERAEWNLWKALRARALWLSSLLFFAVYAATNYYIFLDIEGFRKTIWSLKEYTKGYDEYGKLNLAQWIPFLKSTFTQQIHMSALPFILTGMTLAWRRKDPFLRTCLSLAAILTLINLLTTRHTGINARILPILSIFFAVGALYWMERPSRLIKLSGFAFTFTALFFCAAQTGLAMYLLKSPTNLTRAGHWIEREIPKGSSIGVVSAQVSQSVFPQFAFFDYRLVRFPGNDDAVPAGLNKLPDYVVADNYQQPLLQSHYELIKSWRRKERFLGFLIEDEFFVYGNNDVLIYRKI